MITKLNPFEAFVRGLFSALGSLGIIVFCLAGWASVTILICMFSFIPGMLISEMPVPWSWVSAFIIMMSGFLIVNSVKNHNAKQAATRTSDDDSAHLPSWISNTFVGISLAAIWVSLNLFMIGDYEYGDVPGNLHWNLLPSLLIAQAIAFILGLVYLRSEAKRRREEQSQGS